jgi:RNA polymerase sigma factor (sigma-70 family)
MTQKELSQIFKANYNELKEYSTKASKVFSKNYEINSLISECYIYLHDKIESLHNEADVVSWAKTWLRNNIRWSNSNYHKIENGRPHHDEFQEEEFSIEDPIHSDEINSLILSYYSLLTPRKKRLFSIYIEKDLKKGKDVASHLNISISGAYGIISECKEVESSFKKWITHQI